VSTKPTQTPWAPPPRGSRGAAGAAKSTRKTAFLLLACLVGGHAAQEPAAVDSPPANLALVAVASTSYVSGHETLAALNDGVTPRNSNDQRHGAYGNWPQTGTHWVQYDWSQLIATDRIEVYWFDDARGVRLPRACRLKSWDGQAFVPVLQASGLGLAPNQFNLTTFPEVTTSRLRLEFDSDGQNSTGLLEWRVCDSGNSPDFPPTVTAGADRIVLQGGKTFLAGQVKTLKPAAAGTGVEWSKESGPGPVRFDSAAQAQTTASFADLGDYTLRFTAQAGALSASDTLRVRVQAPPSGQCLEPIHTRHFKVDSRLWSSRLKALMVAWIPHCIAKISDPELREGGINNFLEAAHQLAGRPHGRHRGYVFANAWVYNTIEAICLALMIDPQGDPEIGQAQQQMKATLEDWIPKVLAAQEPDGYLQTAFTLDERKERWSPRLRGDHEGYVAGYLLEAAIAHHLLTEGRDVRLYRAARRLADCWCDHIGPAPKQPWYDGHQAMEMALVRFGRYVGEVEGAGQGRKYLELAKFLLDCRDDGSEYDQSHVPAIQQYTAVGHAVRAAYSYAAMADVVLEFGDRDYGSAVQSIWDNLVHRKYYVTGGIGSGETSEGFGPDYSLRHNAYCESCSSCGLVFFQHRLNRWHRDARYADLYEETLYNALLGSVDLAGKNFYYQNPLDGNRPRYDWHGCPCCVGNIPRTLLSLPTWMYLKSPDTIYVNLFIGSTVTVPNVAGTDVQIVQRTDYPWSGNVTLTIQPAQPTRFTVKVRVPDRDVSDLYTGTPSADGLDTLAVNRRIAPPIVERGYAILTRTWQPGDTIEIALPLPIQRVRTSDRVAANRDRVALRYGPLLYNLESVDQDLEGILDPASALSTQWRPDLLDGVAAIQGAFADGAPLLAIPNYARLNRGGRSLVWIRER